MSSLALNYRANSVTAVSRTLHIINHNHSKIKHLQIS